MAQRNHYISRFLLNRFASRHEKRKNKYWIWEISRNSNPRELSTNNVAIVTNFYGKPETGVEKAFAVAEDRFRNVLVALDAGQPPHNHAEGLRGFVYLQAVRTRALRSRFIDAFDLLLAELPKSARTASTREKLEQEVQTSLQKRINQEIEKLPPVQQPLARMFMEAPAVQQALVHQMRAFLTEDNVEKIFSDFVDLLRNQKVVPKSAQEGHVRSLGNLLKAQHVPEMFSPKYWQLISDGSGGIILGDACAFAVTEDGRCGPLLKLNGELWREIYMPISSTTVLVASRERMTPSLGVDQINRVSAEQALSYIYASRVDEEITDLASLIGTGGPVLDSEEVADIVRNI